jgi:DNA-binding SARP family transcriptional activator/TolB-like protein
MIQLKLFGSPRISRHEPAPDTLLKRSRRWDLLLYVSDEPNPTRSKIADVFWGESDDEAARHALSQALYALKKTLGEELFDELLEVQDDRIALRRNIVVDTRLFEELGAAREYQRAIDLYTAPFLNDWEPKGEGNFGPWADSRRRHYERLFSRYVGHHLEALQQAGAIDDAIACARHAVKAAPTDDGIHLAALELLGSVGQYDEALRVYDIYARQLAQDDLKPVDQFAELVTKLRKAAVTQRVEGSTRGGVAPVARSDPPDKPQPRSKARILATAAVAIALLGAGLLWAALPRRNSVALSDASLNPDLVAILPFAELASASQAPRADSLRARVAADLRRNPQMQIADLQKTEAAARRYTDLNEIASSLKALALVGGSVTSSDSAVTVVVQVWDGGTGSVVSSKRWHSVQPASTTAMVEDVGSYLNSQLLQVLRMLTHRRDARSSEAWQVFNRAWEHYRNSVELAGGSQLEAGLRVLVTADSIAAAAERADAEWLAPTLLRAQIAQRAFTWSRHPAARRTPAEIKTWGEAAIAQAGRALERSPGSVDALELRGLAQYNYWTYLAGEQTRDDHALLRRAERDLQDAAAADAKRSQARLYLADIYHARAQFKEEKAMALAALNADPLAARDRNILYRIAMASFYLDEPVEALRMCRDGQQRFPTHVPFQYCELFVLAHADKVRADVTRAQQIVDQLARPENAPAQRAQLPLFRMLQANVLARAGLPDNARAEIARAAAEAPGSVSLMYPEASAWTRLGDYDRALDILEQDAAIDPVWIKATLLNPSFDPLRSHPRFQALIDKYMPARS